MPLPQNIKINRLLDGVESITKLDKKINKLKNINIFKIQTISSDIITLNDKDIKLLEPKIDALNIFLYIINKLVTNIYNINTKDYNNKDLRDTILLNIYKFFNNYKNNNYNNYIISNYKIISFLNYKSNWEVFNSNMKYRYIINNKIDYIILGNTLDLSPIYYIINKKGYHYFHVIDDINNYFKIININENRISKDLDMFDFNKKDKINIIDEINNIKTESKIIDLESDINISSSIINEINKLSMSDLILETNYKIAKMISTKYKFSNLYSIKRGNYLFYGELNIKNRNLKFVVNLNMIENKIIVKNKKNIIGTINIKNMEK